jgi:hypothetical protein
LTTTKASLTEQKWQAQWQQNPTSEEGSIIKREWWKKWEEDSIPDLIHVIQSYDTAYSKKGDRRLLSDHHLGHFHASGQGETAYYFA